MSESKLGLLNSVIKHSKDQQQYLQSSYLHGFINGLIMAQAIMTAKEAEFIELQKDYFEKKEEMRNEN